MPRGAPKGRPAQSGLRRGQVFITLACWDPLQLGGQGSKQEDDTAPCRPLCEAGARRDPHGSSCSLRSDVAPGEGHTAVRQRSSQAVRRPTNQHYVKHDLGRPRAPFWGCQLLSAQAGMWTSCLQPHANHSKPLVGTAMKGDCSCSAIHSTEALLCASKSYDSQS